MHLARGICCLPLQGLGACEMGQRREEHEGRQLYQQLLLTTQPASSIDRGLSSSSRGLEASEVGCYPH